MQEAVPAGQGAMAALIGLLVSQVREICQVVTRDGKLAVPANLNAPGNRYRGPRSTRATGAGDCQRARRLDVSRA